MDTYIDPHAPGWLISNSSFDWNASAPSAQAAFLVRSIIESRYTLTDISVLAFDFVRHDYRQLCLHEVFRSVWVYYFIGEYLRRIHHVKTDLDPDQYPEQFLVVPEVVACPIWGELYEVGRSISQWVQFQRSWKKPRLLGGYFSAAWWTNFDETHRLQSQHQHGFAHTHPLVNTPGTGLRLRETPHGLAHLDQVTTVESVPVNI